MKAIDKKLGEMRQAKLPRGMIMAYQEAYSEGINQGLSFDDAIKHAELKTAQRSKLADKTFALPDQRMYPIPDISHARNALARVAQMGSADEKAKVRAAVARKFPEIGK